MFLSPRFDFGSARLPHRNSIFHDYGYSIFKYSSCISFNGALAVWNVCGG